MKSKATLLVLACFAIAPLAAKADYVDGFGDAVDSFGVGGPVLDIDSLSIQFDSTTLYFEMLFHTPISAGSQFNDDSVVGVIEFDTDQSDETGTFPIQNNFAPSFAVLDGVGVDYLLSIDDSGTPGSGVLLDANLNFVSSVDIEFGPNSLGGQIALSDLGGDDGLLNFTTTIGTVPQPTDATDSVGTSTPVSAIPEPSSLALMMSVGAFGLVRRRR